jgi:hypothetical protein
VETKKMEAPKKKELTEKMSIVDFFFSELTCFEKSMFDLDYTGSFKSDIKACYKSNLDLKCFVM